MSKLTDCYITIWAHRGGIVGGVLEVERIGDGRSFYRHPDDVKKFDSPYQRTAAENETPPNLWEEHWKLISDCAQQDTSGIDLWPHDVQPRDAREIPVPVDAGAAPDAACSCLMVPLYSQL